MWLSRSWTTRDRRPGEPPDAYHFVDRATFEAKARDGGFVEWVEFLPGQLSGTPVPTPPAGEDIVLEIDVRGAAQVKERFPDAVVILVVPPSRSEQEIRLRGRGDPPDLVAQRLEMAAGEEEAGRDLADHVIVNDDLDRAVEEVAAIVEAHRSTD
ncbi:MAG: gmk [Acidimicrobiales bacterium]|nr:gmk [Acidimicrobiales bacterium]